MSGTVELIAFTVLAALLPAGMHFNGLRGAPLRPPKMTQRNTLERLFFRHLPLLLVINGALVGAVVFLAKTGLYVPAGIVGTLTIPGLVTQLAALTIEKSRDVAGVGRRS